MQSRDELLQAVRVLPNQTKLFTEPYKDTWLDWLSQYADKTYEGGSYPRKNPDRDGKFIFNKLNNPWMIIWLAEASGVGDQLLQKALNIVGEDDDTKENLSTVSAAVRKILPWELVENHLETALATTKPQRHFIAYHNADTRGPYGTNRSHGAFLTNKNFRAETLQGQHLWVFEGSGLPKIYRMVSHGTITKVTRDAAGEATVRFKIEAPQVPAIVTGLPWFKHLLVQQRSFANGFSSLIDTDVIQSLQKIADSSEALAVEAEVKPTTAQALIDARLGQGQFRAALEREWNGACAVTGCDILQVLRASHIKPWGVSTDAERLNSNNGLLLSANIDALFDKGLISFKDDGMMMVSKQVSLRNRMRLRLSGKLCKKLNKKQKQFLDYHRSVVFES